MSAESSTSLADRAAPDVAVPATAPSPAAPAVAPYRPFADLIPATLARLQALPMPLLEVAVPPAHATQLGANGRIQLEAWEWQIGAPALAVCRAVRIHGAATDIINTMTFPLDASRLPCYAAELLTFGRSPKLVFVDLQTPGMPATAQARVRERLAPLAARYADLPDGGECPDWARRFSAGPYIYSRPCDSQWEPAICQLYLDYLDAWCALAADAAPASPAASASPGDAPSSCVPDAPCDAPCDALRAYQVEHLTHTPGTKFLGKVFGDEWAVDFMEHWLYRPVHPATNPYQEAPHGHHQHLA